MSREPIVKTISLSKTFGSQTAVSSCSLSVEAGTVYGLLGRNGAGKTTLLKMLLGLLKPTCGSAVLFGLDSRTDSVRILKQVGALIETPVFYENLSARENLRIHLEYMGCSGDVSTALRAVGLASAADSPVASFSLGMRQRLAIARAIVHRPGLLILDEPLNGLDPVGMREMRELFLRLTKEEGTAILLSSHILSEVEKTADQIGFMSDGKLLAQTTPEAVNAVYHMDLEEYFFQLAQGGITDEAAYTS